jgi:hypothetical protein
MGETMLDLNMGDVDDYALIHKDTLAWLIYFYENADFGPAHEDVVMLIQEQFEATTGKTVPEYYRYS